MSISLGDPIDKFQPTKPMRLGLFGGTFDPVHYGHLLVAECCREQARLDAVWFLPAATPPHKSDCTLTPGASRIEMLKLAIGGHEAFAVCPLEIERGGISYTVDTLEHLRREEPESELFLLLGADTLADLPNWWEPMRICQLALPLVVRRGTTEPDFACLAELMPPDRLDSIRTHMVEMPAIGLSSSGLRQRVLEGRSIRYQTPRAVELYIREQSLYHAADA